MKPEIEFSEYMEIESKLDIRYGTIIHVERIPKNKKMLRLVVDFGEDEPRNVITNLGDRFEDPIDVLLHEQYPFVMNLKPAMKNGFLSQAMIIVPAYNDELCTSGVYHNGTKLI